MLHLVCSRVITNVIFAAILHLMNQKMLMGLGTASYIAAFLLLGFMNAETSYWAFVFPALILLAVREDLHYNIANIYVMSSLPQSHQSIAGGIFSTATKILSNIALGIATSVYTSMDEKVGSKSAEEDVIRPYLAVSWFSDATAGVAFCFLPFLKVGKQNEGAAQKGKSEEYGGITRDDSKGRCEARVDSV